MLPAIKYYKCLLNNYIRTMCICKIVNANENDHQNSGFSDV